MSSETNSPVSGPIVGIDLGTTNSAVAGFVQGKLRIIKVDGRTSIPSIVGVNADGKLVNGVTARNQLAAFPDRTVASIKRKMGTDERVLLGDESYSAPEISAIILKTLKDAASQVFGEEVRRAVITVPAYFDEHQRQATRQAGELAGLHVERIINEPTAATLVYHVDKKDRKNIAVYDLGGGTFDVSIVRMEAGVIEVLASQGDTHLGGDDFDNLLLDYVADEFKEQHGVDLRDNPQSRFRLLQACEQAKIQLSELETVSIAEEFIAEKEGQPLHLQIDISREELNEMITPWIDKTIDCVGKALRDCSMVAHQIDDLVLVGGSTRIPLVEERLREQFLREPSHAVDPDLAVAMGAGVQAAMLHGDNVGPVLVDVSTHTLGIDACVDFGFNGPVIECVPLIRRGTPLPNRYEKSFSKIHPEQARVEVGVFQGEHTEPEKNTRIAGLNLDLTGADEEHAKLVVGFQLTLDGVLRVSIKQPASGRFEEVSIENARSILPPVEEESAKERIRSMFSEVAPVDASIELDEDEVAQESESGGSTVSRQHSLAIAKEKYPKVATLLDLAVKLRPKVQGEDMEELDRLCEKIHLAIEEDDSESLEFLATDLDDLLFYVQ